MTDTASTVRSAAHADSRGVVRTCLVCQADATGVCESCWDDSVRAHRSIATPLLCEDCGGEPVLALEGLGIQADHAHGSAATCATCGGHGLVGCSYCKASVATAPAVQLVEGYPACERCALEDAVGVNVELDAAAE